MHRIVAGATGLIGKRLVEHWLHQYHTVTVIGRTEAHIRAVFQNRVRAITWEQVTPELLKTAEVVVNLAGANVAEKNWTPNRKREIIDSRVHATQKLAALLALLGQEAPPLFNASAIGVYGVQPQETEGLPVHVDETTDLLYAPPKDYLATVARAWEAAPVLAVNKGVRVVFLRFGVVLAKEGGALAEMAKPFKFFLGGPVGTGKQPLTWVAIDDVLRAIDFLITKSDASGAYNVVSPGCVTQAEFAKALGKALHRPSWLRMPASLITLIFGEMGRDLLLEGVFVYPKRLLDAGFKFHYPKIEPALQYIYKR